MNSFRAFFLRGLSVVTAVTIFYANASAASQAPVAPSPDNSSPQTEALRPEMANVLKFEKIKEQMAAKNYAAVQQTIDEVAAFANLTSYESYIINRIRIALGSATGNNAMVMAALPPVIESGRLDPAQRKQFIKSLAAYLYNAKDFAGANRWYQRLNDE